MGSASPNESKSTTRPDARYWQCSVAEKGAFLLDGASYYRAFRETLLQAEHYACLLAWDLTGDTELIRDGSPDDGLPTKLVDFLYALLDRKPDLEIYILLWDYSMVYIAEREWLPFSKFRQNPHPRLHLVSDSAINAGASHHQKVVVADGGFAFNGGLDFSKWRWDTTEHAVDDPRRVTPDGEHYQPYHDIQTAVTGPAARTLDALCRDRWHRATGHPAPWPACEGDNKIWPESLEPAFENEPAAFALTYSAYKEYPAVTQVESLHLDRIASAERYIYLENQYLSSHAIADALAQRLDEPDGPEIILIITRDTGGWLEEGTLGLLRSRLLEKLRSADCHGRFAAYFPHVTDPDGKSSQVYVHAKAMIVDDASLLHGSANLSNRSMKVDSEVVMALGLSAPARVSEALLHRLLAIHLGTRETTVAASLKSTGSIHGTIRDLRTDSRHQLRDLHYDPLNSVQRKLADTQLLDPDDPIDLGYWLRQRITAQDKAKPTRNWRHYLSITAGVLAIFLLGLGLKEAWGSAIKQDDVETFFQSLNQSAWVLPTLFIIFLLTGLSGLSINLILVSATLVIGPWSAFGCGFSGSLVSAVAAFYLGRFGGQPVLQKFFADRLDGLSRKISERGVISVALLRLVPIAPFVVINLVAGLSNMRLKTFFLGSCLGMIPGMLAVVFVTFQAKSAYTNPSWETWLYLALGVLALGTLSIGVRKFTK
jgi:phosphatidylserine/phosphatidylglycerophosphate/cardiolipin synthase-like enzyme/uncharacterized membrane protein YdjX (TVP38/TMEM64 family)